MAAKATYIGLDKILSAFEEKADTPFFSLWVGKARAEMNKDNDFDKASAKLEKQIKAFAEEDMNDVFVIALHPEKKVSYKFEDCKDATLMYCQAKRSDSPVMYQGGNNSQANYMILEKLNSIESRINAIEAEEVEEEEGEEIGSTEAVLIDKISGIVNSPLVGILLNFLQNNSVKPAPVTALAGTDELDEVLNTLFSKGVTVQHLKKLASYPQDKISMLLTML